MVECRWGYLTDKQSACGGFNMGLTADFFIPDPCGTKRGVTDRVPVSFPDTVGMPTETS